MGYPQQTQAVYQPSQSIPNGPQTVQDPISNVLTQALQQCEEVESRLKNLRDRLDIGPSQLINEKRAESQPRGIVSQANDIRNTSARLQSLCGELETML